MAIFENLFINTGLTGTISGPRVVIRSSETEQVCAACGESTRWSFGMDGSRVWTCSHECAEKSLANMGFPAPATDDPVNAPSHYASGGVEVIDALEAWGLDRDFCLGNVVKYVARAGKKDPSKLTEDLKKARWYLGRRIKQLETNG